MPKKNAFIFDVNRTALMAEGVHHMHWDWRFVAAIFRYISKEIEKVVEWHLRRM